MFWAHSEVSDAWISREAKGRKLVKGFPKGNAVKRSRRDQQVFVVRSSYEDHVKQTESSNDIPKCRKASPMTSLRQMMPKAKGSTGPNQCLAKNAAIPQMICLLVTKHPEMIQVLGRRLLPQLNIQRVVGSP